MNQPLEQTVIHVIATTKGMDPAAISPSTTMEALGLDSLDGMSMIFDLENAFDIEIPDEAAERATTVGDLIEGVRQLIAAKD